jgi:glycerate dehydrogenase
MDACPRLKYIGVFATGYDNVDIAYAAERGIAVTNVPSYSTASVAQFTFALLLEAVNAVGVHSSSVRCGDWEKSEDFCYNVAPQIELAGRTLGVVGYGSIGRRVCRIAEAMDMHTIAYTPHPPGNDSAGGANGNTEFVSLDALFARSDVISLHCPLTDATKSMINKDSIAGMKDGAILLNTARGGLIEEFDLAVALKSGKLTAAGLDVLALEPPTKNNLLIGIENCMITPHIAWSARDARKRCIDITYTNAASWINGEKVNRVER